MSKRNIGDKPMIYDIGRASIKDSLVTNDHFGMAAQYRMLADEIHLSLRAGRNIVYLSRYACPVPPGASNITE